MKDLVGFFGHGLFLMAILLFLLQGKRWKQYWPIPYLIAAIVIVVPIQSWLLIEFSRGYFSDLSVATILICALAVMNHARPHTVKIGMPFHIFILILALVLYPYSMGLSKNDPFVLGYSTASYYSVFVLALVTVAVLAWLKGYMWIALLLALALWAQGLDIYGSGNLWLYLLDPIAVIISVCAVLSYVVRCAFRKIKKNLDMKRINNVSEHA